MSRLVQILTLFALGISIGFGQSMGVPVPLQAQIIERVATFDRNFRERAGDEIRIALIFQSKYRASRIVKQQLEEAHNQSNMFALLDLSSALIPVDLSEDIDLPDILNNNKIDIIYVAPLRAQSIETIAKSSRALKIRTFTGVPSYVEAGLAIGFELRGNSPQILVNLRATKLEGSDYSSRLLELSRIVDE